MQLLANYRISAGYDRFKAAFDADNEDRGQNSLSLLQLWREDDSSIWALYNITDAAAARAYLNGAADVFNNQAGVTATDFHFVETV